MPPDNVTNPSTNHKEDDYYGENRKVSALADEYEYRTLLGAGGTWRLWAISGSGWWRQVARPSRDHVSQVT